MAKFSGKVGFVKTEETSPGIYQEVLTERHYYGDANRVARRVQSADSVNDNIVVNNEISIVADQFAIDNFYYIKHVMFMGAKWKVTNADLQRPRVIMTLGEVFNG